jgi:hypothetical protein
MIMMDTIDVAITALDDLRRLVQGAWFIWHAGNKPEFFHSSEWGTYLTFDSSLSIN